MIKFFGNHLDWKAVGISKTVRLLCFIIQLQFQNCKYTAFFRRLQLSAHITPNLTKFHIIFSQLIYVRPQGLITTKTPFLSQIYIGVTESKITWPKITMSRTDLNPHWLTFQSFRFSCTFCNVSVHFSYTLII